MFSWLKKLFTRKPAKMPTFGAYHPPANVLKKYRAYRESMGALQHTIWHMPPPLPTWGYAKSRVRDVLADVAESFEYVPDFDPECVVDDWTKLESPFTFDEWRVPKQDIDGIVRGDCDGFAGFVKQKLLIAGFHESWLRLATCYVENGAYHMALVVTCTDRDMVLDNRYPQDTWAWASLGYRWHYREDGRGGFELLTAD